MHIARATNADSTDIWIRRNDPHTRAMSMTSQIIDWSSHSEWHNKTLVNANRYLYIGRMPDGKKVGMCRFDVQHDGQSAEVSLNLNPAMRGRKLSYEVLDSCIAEFWSIRPVLLSATVKKQNMASIKCFTGCGFVFARQDSEYIYYALPPASVAHSHRRIA